MSERPLPAGSLPASAGQAEPDDPLESIRAILLSEDRIRLEELRALLEAFAARSHEERSALAAEVAALSDRLRAELGGEKEHLLKQQQRMEELAAAVSRLESLVPRSPDALVNQIKPVMGDLVGRSIREQPEVMAEALGPVMGEAIRAQIRESRQEMIDALFPIIGATIQRAISEFFREFQRNIDARLRIRSTPLGWLQQAWSRLRGVPASELTLRGALPFSLEQLFLVQPGSGLLMADYSLRPAEHADTDLIGSMLTAIRDFAEDSFGDGDDGEDLDEIQYGDERILIESGPAANLAIVIAGVEPQGFRAQMRQLLLDLHVQHETAMRRFQGDPGTLPNLSADLAAFARALPEEVAAGAPLSAGQRRLLVLGAGGGFVALLVGCFYLFFTVRLLPVAFPGPTPLPTMTATARATPTAVPTPTVTPLPTITALPPTSTAMAQPTATPTAAPTPIQTNTPAPTASNTPAPTAIPRLTVYLWSRESPSGDAPLFRIIPIGSELTVIERDERWLLVAWEDQGTDYQGWIPERWLPTPPTP